MKTSDQLVFFGTEAFSAPSLEALISHGFNVVAVVTKPDTQRGRGRAVTEPLVKTIAQRYDIPVFQPHKLSELESELKKMSPIAGVLVAYGKIIPKSILDVFTPGIINIHPSKLPRYRGPAPIEAAIKNGDTETAISIMQLTAGMDEGPIYLQQPVPLDNRRVTRPELYKQLAEQGAELLVATLPGILDGTIEPKQQQTDGVSYTTLISKQDGNANPITETATDIERKTRAHLGFPKTRITFKDNDVIITSAKVVDHFIENELVLLCKNDSYLLVESLIAPSGKSMSGSAFLRGLR